MADSFGPSIENDYEDERGGARRRGAGGRSDDPAGCGFSRGAGRGGGGRGQYRRVMLETAVLLSLMEGEAHGYSLIEDLAEKVGGQVCVDPGSVYRLLRTMEQEGSVASSWQPAEAGPSRRTYAITEHGAVALAQQADFLRQRAGVMLDLARDIEEIMVAERSTRVDLGAGTGGRRTRKTERTSGG